MSTSGGYHEYIRGCSVLWGMFSTSVFSIVKGQTIIFYQGNYLFLKKNVRKL